MFTEGSQPGTLAIPSEKDKQRTTEGILHVGYRIPVVASKVTVRSEVQTGTVGTTNEVYLVIEETSYQSKALDAAACKHVLPPSTVFVLQVKAKRSGLEGVVTVS